MQIHDCIGFQRSPSKETTLHQRFGWAAVPAMLNNGSTVRLLVPDGINSILTTLQGTCALLLKKETFPVLRVDPSCLRLDTN